MTKLRGKDRKLFDEFLMMEASQSDDLGAANAKLAGEWPGWEWMKTARQNAETPSDCHYAINQDKPWKEGTPRLDTQMGYCWVVNEKGQVTGSFQLADNQGRAMAKENIEEAKRFFAKYYPDAAKTPNADIRNGDRADAAFK